MFGEKFRHWRESKELSQLEIARKLGVTQQAVANWEMGIRHPHKRLWKRIMEITEGEITIDDLLEIPRKPTGVR